MNLPVISRATLLPVNETAVRGWEEEEIAHRAASAFYKVALKSVELE